MIYTDRDEIVDSYMRSAISAFKHVCIYDLVGTADDDRREFSIDIEPFDVEEIVDIVSEGMVEYFIKPYLYNQEVLQNALNTRDFTLYSPSGMLNALRSAHKDAHDNFIQKVREYSYDHRNLRSLHL